MVITDRHYKAEDYYNKLDQLEEKHIWNKLYNLIADYDEYTQHSHKNLFTEVALIISDCIEDSLTAGSSITTAEKYEAEPGKEAELLKKVEAKRKRRMAKERT